MSGATPYALLQQALLTAGAQRIAEVAGPNPTGPSGSSLEFWTVPTPPVGRVVLVQRWNSNGGWDAYVPIRSHKTDSAINEVLHGQPWVLDALQGAESFISGFEDCDNPEDRPTLLLDGIRASIKLLRGES